MKLKITLLIYFCHFVCLLQAQSDKINFKQNPESKTYQISDDDFEKLKQNLNQNITFQNETQYILKVSVDSVRCHYFKTDFFDILRVFSQMYAKSAKISFDYPGMQIFIIPYSPSVLNMDVIRKSVIEKDKRKIYMAELVTLQSILLKHQQAVIPK